MFVTQPGLGLSTPSVLREASEGAGGESERPRLGRDSDCFRREDDTDLGSLVHPNSNVPTAQGYNSQKVTVTL